MWTHTGEDVNGDPTYDWVQDSAADEHTIGFPRQIENVMGEWEQKTSQIEVPVDWDLTRAHTFAIDGNFGDNGIM